MSSKIKKVLIILLILIAAGFGLWFLTRYISQYKAEAAERAILKAQNQAIEDLINSRRVDKNDKTFIDPFGDDGVARVLFIGLDKRVGQENGHCDAIQMITIDKNLSAIEITAVPRGTYSPLPPGKGATSSDYYVSNACGFGGLEYGVNQIEKILGVKADYLVVVGFSETMGILRNLKLPTTETLQWLRNRHGYAIGEPQRAHNHSTFIKQMMIKYVPTEKSVLDKPLQYIIYKLVKTDLSFEQVQFIVDSISNMDVANHPEKIKLSMRPLYAVQDIAYDPDNVGEYLEQTLGPIKHLLSKDDYSTVTKETLQENLLKIIEENKDKSEFAIWAYQNNIWLQIEDQEKSLAVQYVLFTAYLSTLTDKTERQAIISDYIIEMENRGETVWQEKGRILLSAEMGY